MNKLRIVALCLLPVLPCFAAADAKAIMQGVEKQDTSHDATLKAVFDVFDAQGHKTQKRFTVQRLGSVGASKIIVRFTDPPELRGLTLLSADQRQWIYTPATARVRSVQPREQSEHFAATDFTYEDIEERIGENFTYRLLSDSEMLDGHKTYKIEAVPVDATRSQYKFIYFWVSQDIQCIIHAEMYDATGEKIRVMHASGFRKVSGFWGARRMEMRSPKAGTRTVLTIDDAKFNKGLDPALFTPESLAKN